jgi:hypothetical protein
VCRRIVPPVQVMEGGHSVACHHFPSEVVQ